MYETLEEVIYSTAEHSGEHGFTIGGGVDRSVHNSIYLYVAALCQPEARERTMHLMRDNLVHSVVQSQDTVCLLFMLTCVCVSPFGDTISSRPVSIGDTSVYITHIVEGGAADVDGRLQVEDRLVEINGNKIENMSYDQVLLALRQACDGGAGSVGRDLTIVIARLPSTVEERCSVAFPVGSGGLGFTFRGGGGDGGNDDDVHTDKEDDEGGAFEGDECGIFVVSVVPSGSAAGHLCVDDQIMEVNGQYERLCVCE